MLQHAGFRHVELINKNKNFSTFIAIKITDNGTPDQNPNLNNNYQTNKVISNSNVGSITANSPTPFMHKFFDVDPDYLHTLLGFNEIQILNRERLSFYNKKLPRFADLEKVALALKSINPFESNTFNGNVSAVVIGNASELHEKDKDTFLNCLEGLKPWKKGPFVLFGHPIDSEWYRLIYIL